MRNDQRPRHVLLRQLRHSRKQARDLGGAAEAAGKAQTWCWVSFGLGLIVIILNVIITIADMK
ncbi:MAG TPA: CD225/dispanin family protein [Pyrinomonadaceae bacterium]|nr:CD225/dispanin family protein [Pyrinomonadaceae bacterium]